jgi:hypothetical protein
MLTLRVTGRNHARFTRLGVAAQEFGRATFTDTPERPCFQHQARFALTDCCSHTTYFAEWAAVSVTRDKKLTGIRVVLRDIGPFLNPKGVEYRWREP